MFLARYVHVCMAWPVLFRFQANHLERPIKWSLVLPVPLSPLEIKAEHPETSYSARKESSLALCTKHDRTL